MSRSAKRPSRLDPRSGADLGAFSLFGQCRQEATVTEERATPSLTNILLKQQLSLSPTNRQWRLPTSVVISGTSNLKVLEQNFETTRNFRQMSETEVASLLAKTKDAGETRHLEWFKHYPGGGWTGEHP